MKPMMSVRLAVLFSAALWTWPCSAQQLAFTYAQQDGAAALDSAMSSLAVAALTKYRETDEATSLDNRFRLQIVAGRYEEAEGSIVRLRKLRIDGGRDVLQHSANNLQYQIYARAKAREASNRSTFENEFKVAFKELVEPLNDKTSALVMRMLNVEQYGGLSLILVQPQLRSAVAHGLRSHAGNSTIELADALRLVRDYQIERTYAAIAPLAAPLVEQDDRRRYVMQQNIQVKARDGTPICTQVVRPRSGPTKLPTLLTFTIYADPLVSMSEARRVASNGYAAVTGYTRGKGCSTGRPVLRERDGEDAAAVIDWISAQDWSDGRVGMYGGSYAGFTQWAAAKHMPKALKTIMPAVAMAPGINNPAEGGVAQGSSFYWPHYTADGAGLKGEVYDDTARWDRMFSSWYRKGGAYRSLDVIDGHPNPWFRKWLDHPDFDAYWKAMIPTGNEFAKIDIPILATTGYYDGGLVGTLFYLNEHLTHRPSADHYIVLGPYDHGSGNRGTMGLLGEHAKVLDGIALDPSALVDFGELRFQWFDYVFKGAPKPDILKDRINFQVMGADTWKHVGSLDAMSAAKTRYYLSPTRQSERYSLETKPSAGALDLVVDLADRSDADALEAEKRSLVAESLDTRNGIAFTTAAMERSTELSGAFKATLDFVTNKKDFDFKIHLYEQTASGRYVGLSWHMARASYTKEREHRHLLVRDKPQTISITSSRVTSRRLEAGSRIVAVLSVVKGLRQEINYGTGKTVSDETIADAGAPLRIRLLGSSFLELPLGP